MRIDEKDVRKGRMDGEKVWVCHFNQPDLYKKPLRNVEPQSVLVRSNSETDKKINYSKSHFAVIGKKGQVTKKVIAVFDNTGYRSYPGEPLVIFDSFDECKAEYNEQIKKVMDKVAIMRDNATEQWNNRFNELLGMKFF